MPRTEEANQKIREEQRAKILDAAMTIFAHKGAAATMAEVAAAANVSYGLVYRYFTNKEAIFVELVEHVLADSLRIIEQILEMPATPGERLHLLLSQVVKGLREHPEFLLLIQQVLSNEVARNNTIKLEQILVHASRSLIERTLSNETMQHNLYAMMWKQQQMYRTGIRRLIVEGQMAGEVAGGEPDQLVAAVTACIAGLSQASTWQSPEQYRNTFPDLEIILRMLKP